MYEKIFSRLQELEISEKGAFWIDIRTLESASRPKEPLRPRKQLNIALSLLLGLVAGFALAFFIEYLDSSIKSLEDIYLMLKLRPPGRLYLR